MGKDGGQQMLAMTLGKFNICHIGHLSAFKLALNHADRLIIVLSNGKANADYELRIAIVKRMIAIFMPEHLHHIDFMLGDFKAILLCEPDYFVCGTDRADSFRKSFKNSPCKVLEMPRPEGGISSTYVREELAKGNKPWFISNSCLPLALESAKQYAERTLLRKKK